MTVKLFKRRPRQIVIINISSSTSPQEISAEVIRRLPQQRLA